MYQIIIVDDEVLAIQFLERLVEWEVLNCRIAGTATTTKRVFTLLEDIKPDIVFMDIKMPGMDGLTLSESILNKFPNIEIIVLTAYPDFEFAKKALKLGVTDFLIKHELTSDMVKESVMKSIDKIRKKKIINDMFIKQWMENQWNSLEKDICPIAENKNSKYRLLMIKPQAAWEEIEKNDIHEITLTVHKVKVIGSCMLKSGIIIFLISVDKMLSEAARREAYFRVGNELRYQLSNDFEVSLLGIYSQEFDEVMRYTEICDKMRIMVDVFFYQRHSVVFPDEYGDFRTINPQWKLDGEAFETAVRDRGGFGKYLKSVFNTGQRDFFIIKESLIPISEFYREHYKSLSVRETIIVVSDFEKKEDKIWQCIADEQNENKRCSGRIQQAVQYIKDNYSYDINSFVISEYLNVSEGYFRKLFKAEMGYTVKDYIVSYRIEKSKKYLETGKYKISEISEMCGFKTSQHFSTVFRGIVGMSPGAYISEKNNKKDK